MRLADDSPEGLAEAIGRVLNMPCEEKVRMEEEAYHFVVNEKQWNSQIKRMYGFIETVCDM